MLQENVVDRVRPVAVGPEGVSVAVSHGTVVAAIRDRPGGLLLTPAATGRVLVTLEVPLGRAVGYWHPDSRFSRTIRADYEGVTTSSLVSSAPIGCLYDDAGSAILGFALGELAGEVLLRFGVSEERKTFVVHVEYEAWPTRSVELVLAGAGASFESTVAMLVERLHALAAGKPLPVPGFALEPVYSTWYSFGQEVRADALEVEARIARELGIRSIFIDDGWQRHARTRGYAGCGDWVPDVQKFPDFRGHVENLHALDLKAVLWIAPLYLGERSDAFHRLKHLAPLERAGRVRVLDPRLPEVRQHVVQTCLRLVEDYGLDGLKIDFLEDAALYLRAATPEGDPDVAAGMAEWLGSLIEELGARGLTDPLVEFREPYVGPAMAAFGNVLRAGDCPADVVLNRSSVADLALIANGRAVHSDMLMWDASAGPDAAARQLHSAFLGVPQVSMRLAELPTAHLRALEFGLRAWTGIHEVVREGQLDLGSPATHYPHVGAHHPDGRSVVILYEQSVRELAPARLGALTLVNATAFPGIVLDCGPRAHPVRVQVWDALGELREDRVLNVTGLWRAPVPPSGLAVVTSARRV